MPTLKDQLNHPDLTNVCQSLEAVGLGDLLVEQTVQTLRVQVPVSNASFASPENLAGLDVIVLPDDVKASRLMRCYVRAGSVTGEFTEKAGYGTTPTTGTVGVTPCGDLAFLHADGVTNADVTYVPENGECIDLVLAVNPSTGVCQIPASFAARGVATLLRAESKSGTLLGRMTILVPSNSAPSSTRANLNVAKSQVLFAVADAVSQASVRLLVTSRVNAQLAYQGAALL